MGLAASALALRPLPPPSRTQGHGSSSEGALVSGQAAGREGTYAGVPGWPCTSQHPTPASWTCGQPSRPLACSARTVQGHMAEGHPIAPGGHNQSLWGSLC